MPVRIYEIAKKVGIPSKEVLAKAKELGIANAKVASSTPDKITAEYLEEQIAGKPEPEAPAEEPQAAAEPVIITAPVEEETPQETEADEEAPDEPQAEETEPAPTEEEPTEPEEPEAAAEEQVDQAEADQAVEEEKRRKKTATLARKLDLSNWATCRFAPPSANAKKKKTRGSDVMGQKSRKRVVVHPSQPRWVVARVNLNTRHRLMAR